jgi:hypothetical protein
MDNFLSPKKCQLWKHFLYFLWKRQFRMAYGLGKFPMDFSLWCETPNKKAYDENENALIGCKNQFCKFWLISNNLSL